MHRSTLPGSTATANTAQSLRMPQTAAPASSRNHINSNPVSDSEGNGRDRLPDCDHNNNDNGDNNGYVVNCIHENKPFPLNDVARPEFVNHYYAVESWAPVTYKKLIHLDECGASMENSMRNPQSQGSNCKSVETLQESLRILISTNKDFRVTGPSNYGFGQNRGFHSEFVEPSQNLLGTLNVGKSWVQSVGRVDAQQVPRTGYEDFRQELQTYPVSRELVTVQPTASNSTNKSTLLDLPKCKHKSPTTPYPTVNKPSHGRYDECNATPSNT